MGVSGRQDRARRSSFRRPDAGDRGRARLRHRDRGHAANIATRLRPAPHCHGPVAGAPAPGQSTPRGARTRCASLGTTRGAPAIRPGCRRRADRLRLPSTARRRPLWGAGDDLIRQPTAPPVKGRNPPQRSQNGVRLLGMAICFPRGTRFYSPSCSLIPLAHNAQRESQDLFPLLGVFWILPLVGALRCLSRVVGLSEIPLRNQ